MNIIKNKTVLEKHTFFHQRYAVFGRISAAILHDSPVTIAIAMLFGE
jgi:hypothetical protein